jgi:hypothetical protein
MNDECRYKKDEAPGFSVVENWNEFARSEASIQLFGYVLVLASGDWILQTVKDDCFGADQSNSLKKHFHGDCTSSWQLNNKILLPW